MQDKTLHFIRGDPWFEDGNIVLRIGSEPLVIAFKVHRGVLARNSELFESMFSLPQPSGDDGVITESTIIPVYDNPKELSAFVKAIYDGVTFKDDSIQDFFAAMGILRMATKYLVPRLRSQAISQLARSCPYTLREHDEMIGRALHQPRVDGLSYPYVHPLHMLKIARESGVRTLLPTALYTLSVYPLNELLRGEHPKLNVEHPSRPASHIDEQDLRDYTLMYQHRLDLLFDFIRDFCPSQTNHPGCNNPPNCNRTFAKLGSQFARSWHPRTSPLHLSAMAMEEYQNTTALCELCRSAFRTRAKIHRQRMWDGLPGVVGLPSWDVLVAEVTSTTDMGPR